LRQSAHRKAGAGNENARHKLLGLLFFTLKALRQERFLFGRHLFDGQRPYRQTQSVERAVYEPRKAMAQEKRPFAKGRLNIQKLLGGEDCPRHLNTCFNYQTVIIKP
jgi:hypothetical protein